MTSAARKEGTASSLAVDHLQEESVQSAVKTVTTKKSVAGMKKNVSQSSLISKKSANSSLPPRPPTKSP